MNNALQNARSIVYEILKEIETRAYTTSPEKSDLIKRFQDDQRTIEDTVSLDFTRGIPGKYTAHIREVLGSEFIEYMDQGKIWKNKDKLHLIYKKLSVLLGLYRYYKKEAQKTVHEVDCLRRIKHELVESQVAHVQEAETLEARLRQYQMLMMIVLEPFEDAMKTAMSFLEAQQLEVFLFDDDKFLAAALKTDGKSFVYNKEDEKPAITEAVNEVKMQEVQESTLALPLIMEGRQIGHLRITRQITEDFDKTKWQQDVEWITPVLARIIESNKNRLQTHKVYIDDLTLLYNKRKLNEQMGKLFTQLKQGTKKLYMAMLDIDRFKILNDTWGHPVGDEILKQTAAIIKAEVPYAYRYGGEEFAAVFYGFDKEQTMESVERLRRRVEETPYFIKGKRYGITISAGVAEFQTHMHSVMDAIDHADQALYASKEDGRNRCTYYDDVKDRIAADAVKLRQKVLQLEEKNMRLAKIEEDYILLSKQLAGEKRKPKAGALKEK
ncbi:MAG: GGDEF domain-containing protein [Pseudomonadota bacterium]